MVVRRQYSFDLLALCVGQVRVLVQPGLQALNLLKALDEPHPGGVALQPGHPVGLGLKPLRPHELAQAGDGLSEPFDDGAGLFDQPDLAGSVGLYAGKQRDGGIDAFLLLAEVDDMAVRLGRVQHAVGAGKGLDQAVMPEGLVDVERVEKPGVETGQQHVDDDGDVDLFRPFARQVAVGKLLLLDALLHIPMVEVEAVEGVDVVVGVVPAVVVGDDRPQRGLLALGIVPVVLLFLQQVFLNLPDVRVAVGRRREQGGDFQGHECRVGGRPLRLHRLEGLEIGDGVVDRGRGEQGVETSSDRRGGVFVENRPDHRLLGRSLLDRPLLGDLAGPIAARIGRRAGFVIIDVELQHVFVFDGVGDGIGVQLLLENVRGGSQAGDVAFDPLDARIGLENRRAGKAEKLGVREERLDGVVGFAELRPVAFVEDEDHAPVAKPLKPPPERPLPKGKTELLDGRHDDLVRVVVRRKTVHKRFGVGVFLDAILLESVELLPRLAVEVLAVDDEQAFVNVGVGLEQRRGLEGGQRLARTGRVPDIAVAAVLVDAVDDGPDRMHLVGAHHQQLLLACHQNHVPADRPAQRAFGQEPVGEVVKMDDLCVVRIRKPVDGQKAFVRIEGEMPRVVVGEVKRIRPVADDEELHEAEQRPGISVAGIVPVADDLLHRPPGTDPERFQFDLNDGNAVHQQHHVIAVMAVVGIDAQLVDDLEGVFAPVPDIDERVIERRAVVADERFRVPKQSGGLVDVRLHDLVAQASELGIGQGHAIQRLELLPEIRFQRRTVADVGPIAVFQALKPLDKRFLKFPLGCDRRVRCGWRGRRHRGDCSRALLGVPAL